MAQRGGVLSSQYNFGFTTKKLNALVTETAPKEITVTFVPTSDQPMQEYEKWFLAAQQDDIETLKMQAYFGARDQLFQNKTALMYAAQKGSLKAINFLVRHEAGCQNLQGLTALHLATIANQPEAINLLYHKEKDLQNAKGKTARQIATEKNLHQIVELMEKLEQAEPAPSVTTTSPVRIIRSASVDFGSESPTNALRLKEQQDLMQLEIRKLQKENDTLREKIVDLGRQQQRDVELNEDEIIGEQLTTEPAYEDVVQDILELKKEVKQLKEIALALAEQLRRRK